MSASESKPLLPMPGRHTSGRWDEEIELLARALPADLARALHERTDPAELLEIVLDLGREPEARVPLREVLLADRPVSASDLEHVANNVGQFGDDNRAGIERTLHRVSAMRNRSGRITGLTMRVGRAVTGTGEIIRDIVVSGQSILLLGKPGIGKTTMLRECARLLADELRKRVVIVDTSNEIGGTIAERGVQLIATAHGQTIENLLVNPTLNDLLGGIQSVTLSDEEARRRGTQKSVLERKAPPTFDVLIEIQDRDRVAIHMPLTDVVDTALRGPMHNPKIRVRTREGRVISNVDVPTVVTPEPPVPASVTPSHPLGIFPYGVSRHHVEQSIRELDLPVRVLGNLDGAGAVLTLKNHYRRRPDSLRQAESRGLPIHILKSNSAAQVRDALSRIYGVDRQDDATSRALAEAAAAIKTVKTTLRPVEIAPQNAYLRRLQHQLVAENELSARSTGKEPQRRLRITPAPEEPTP